MNNKSGKRILHESVKLDSSAIRDFFSKRSKKYSNQNPLISVLYQDQNPNLAKERDVAEKAHLLPLLKVGEHDAVLDLGCGIGRWADVLSEKVKQYHGIDIDKGMVNIAKQRLAKKPNVGFQILPAQQIDKKAISNKGPFSLVIIVGLIMYLNDAECRQMFRKMSSLMTSNAKILIREPIGVKTRLTLNNIWSSEMNCNYSAIYRTADEIHGIVDSALSEYECQLVKSDSLYPENLNNRQETKQYYFMYELCKKS